MDWQALYQEHIETLTEYYDSIFDNLDYQSIIIYSGEPHVIYQDDCYLPYKVNPHFNHWLPLTENPYCFLILKQGKKPKLIYVQPQDYWHACATEPKGFWLKHFDIEIVKTAKQAQQSLPENLQEYTLLCDPQCVPEKVKALPNNEEKLLSALYYYRTYKTDYELACINQANQIAARGHVAAQAAFYMGESELDIHLKYLRAIQARESQTPYSNIIALNKHCAILHYDKYESTDMAENKLKSFLIDAGAQVNGYGSDITRTYAFSDNIFAELVDEFETMQLSLVSQIKANDTFVDLHKKAQLAIGKILQQFNLVKLDAESQVEAGIIEHFYPHGIGHYLGLQTHDVGGDIKNIHGDKIEKDKDFPKARYLKGFEPRTVFTVEPGLYFIDILLQKLKKSNNAKYINWQLVKKLQSYGGVRHEDNIAISSQGEVMNLTEKAFQLLH